MHLVYGVGILFFKFLVKLGYRAEQTQPKCGRISALQSNPLRVGVKNLFFRQRNFSLLLILFITESAIISPDSVSSSMNPKYFTLECCLICISPYFIFSFLVLQFSILYLVYIQFYEIRSKPIYRMFRETNSIQFLQQNVMIDCIKGFL